MATRIDRSPAPGVFLEKSSYLLYDQAGFLNMGAVKNK
jgi:hypothetical protein